MISAAAGFWLRQNYFLPPEPEPDAKTLAKHYAAQSLASFYISLEKPSLTQPEKAKVYGAIVSHHFFAEREITDLFFRLRGQKISTIVIIGPNHFNAGNGPVLVSKKDYSTPWGDLKTDTQLAKRLVESGLAQNEEQPFEKEHSISTLVGFIKYIFPDVKILPIIIKRQADLASAERVGEWLAKELPADALVLVSADFSHHFDLPVTELHDAQSLPVLEKLDIVQTKNIQVDSPQSLAALFKYLQSRQAEAFRYFNTNSARLGNNLDSTDVTSYFFGYYIQGQAPAQKYK